MNMRDNFSADAWAIWTSKRMRDSGAHRSTKRIVSWETFATESNKLFWLHDIIVAWIYMISYDRIFR